MSFLKKIFKKDDDIPEMHLQRNEPKPYYSKEHQCWLIPGKEKEMIEAIAKQNKEPPKKVSSTSQAQPSTNTGTRQKPVINRYAMIIPTENVTDNKQIDNAEDIKAESRENILTARDVLTKLKQSEESLQRNNDMPRQIQGINTKIDSYSYSQLEEIGNRSIESNKIGEQVFYLIIYIFF